MRNGLTIITVLKQIPRFIPLKRESVTAIDLHVFREVSAITNCAAIYALIWQTHLINQGLVGSKSRLSKSSLTVQTSEPISAHMAANLVIDMQLPIENQNGKSVTGWENSIVVLLWLNQRRKYKQLWATDLTKLEKKILLSGTMFL